jgi:hypothetical protein
LKFFNKARLGRQFIPADKFTPADLAITLIVHNETDRLQKWGEQSLSQISRRSLLKEQQLDPQAR